MMEIRPTVAQGFAVTGSSIGSNDHPGAGQVRPPTKIHVFAIERHHRVEATETSEQVGANEQAGRRKDKDVAHRVVLFLIRLAGLDERVDLTEPVEPEPNMLQHPGVIPLGELGPDDPGVRSE